MIGIVHLSDIHFVEGANPAATRVLQIKSAVLSESVEVTDILLVISGDVAYSGKQAEYSLATEFISELEKALAGIKGVQFLGTVIVPGNHDCDFEGESDVRTVLMSTIDNVVGNVTAENDVVEQMLKVQRTFFEFEALIWRTHPQKERLFWARELESSAGKLLVRCFNTAWLSREKEQPGQLFFPVQIVPDLSGTDAALVLSVFHHPYGWLNPENSRAFKRQVETSSDVVLTGHEHDGEVYSRSSSAGANVNYVEGAALQAKDVKTGFNFVKVDLSGKRYEVRLFEWAKDMYEPMTKTVEVFTRNQALLEHQFVNNSEFSVQLDDVGMPFSHPIKEQLTLGDIFVYPDLRVTTVTGDRDSEVVVTSTAVLDYVVGKRRLNIAGAPTSGKTSLAKILYTDMLRKRSLVPVLLSGDQLRGSSAEYVQSAVDKAFEQQYTRRLLNRFKQLDPESKVVIVDDWHKAKLNAKGKGLVVETLGKLFSRVIVLTDDASLVHQMTEAVALGELPGFEQCEIKQFGFRLRGELVTRWEVLGREFEVEEMELTHKISEDEYLLDTLIAKGIVPSFPFFIFSVLQAHDLATDTTNFGSYGHIYHSLLATRLARVNPKNLGMKFAYLSHLAFYMFENGRSALSLGELKTLHEAYEREYLYPMDQGKLLAELEAGQVLSTAGGEVQFKYRYGYYYFVAQYFKDGIDNAKGADLLRERLKAIADLAYNDENAHILIFYLYMSKDRALIEHILGNAQRLFASEGSCDLDRDVEFLNTVYGAPARLEEPSADTDLNREEYRRRRDEADKQEGDASRDAAGDRDIDFSFQSINIMGQVLRNFPADLRADLKLRLARESYALSLRTLRSLLGFLRANLDTFRKDMFDYLKLLQPFSRKPDEELRDVADKAVRFFAELAIFATIKRISVSVGTEDLRDTYQAVRQEAGEGHVPTRLIDLAIRLDHFARIPESDVADLKARVQGNPVAYTTLRLLVGEFLYLFPVDYKVRQRMVTLLDFQPGAATMSGAKRVKRLVTATK